jgi:hypothetical protein
LCSSWHWVNLNNRPRSKLKALGCCNGMLAAAADSLNSSRHRSHQHSPAMTVSLSTL